VIGRQVEGEAMWESVPAVEGLGTWGAEGAWSRDDERLQKAAAERGTEE
jgi:hypothetical protein